jgi:hypothetical protein
MRRRHVIPGLIMVGLGTIGISLDNSAEAATVSETTTDIQQGCYEYPLMEYHLPEKNPVVPWNDRECSQSIQDVPSLHY